MPISFRQFTAAIVGWALLHAAQAQAPASTAFVPGCDLRALNREYIAALNRLRHQLDPQAPIVKFDPVLFTGVVLHTARMEAHDSLVHSRSYRFAAELIGTKRSVQTLDARKVAMFALHQFENSEPHCRAQETVTYVYTAIAASKNYYCVRFAQAPMIADKDEQLAIKNLSSSAAFNH